MTPRVKGRLGKAIGSEPMSLSKRFRKLQRFVNRRNFESNIHYRSQIIIEITTYSLTESIHAPFR